MRLDLKISKLKNISRNKASELIKKGEVFVNEKPILKPSWLVDENDILFVKKNIQYVSRAGEKLAGLLNEFKIDIKDKNCLDIGSSTGGFTQVLLSFEPKNIVCVDVGDNQLHKSLRKESKITLYEKTDIRNFTSQMSFDIITCDVSFIALKDIIEHINNLSNGIIIILFKPQFEVGKEIKRDKKGVLCDQKAINNAHENFKKLACKYWKLLYFSDSILKGKEGNLESFYVFEK